MNSDRNYFSNVNAVFELILSLPVGYCSYKCSLSALRRLKTWSRSTMKDKHVNGIALLSIYNNIPIDKNTVFNNGILHDTDKSH